MRMAVNIEKRVDSLEDVFRKYMRQTSAAIIRLERSSEASKKEMREYKTFTTETIRRMERSSRALEKEMAEFKNEMAEFKNEMTEFKNEMTEFKNEMTEFKNEMAEFKKNTAEFIEEMRQDRRAMNRKWGEIARKMGTMVEDLVHPSFKRIILETFDLEVEAQMFLVERKLPDGREREFDAIALAQHFVFLNSTKATLRNKYVDEFITEIKEFREFFPEYRDKKIIGFIAALNIKPTQFKYAEKKGFFVLGVGDQIMEVKNSKKFKPRIW